MSAVRSGQPAQCFIQLVLKTSKDGACTASLSNRHHCLPVFMGKLCLLISSPSLSCFDFCLLSRPAMYCRAFLCLHPCQYWQVAVRFPPQLSSAGWTSSGPSASPHRASLPALIILVTLCWTHPSLSMSLLYWGAPDWMQYSWWVLRDNSFPWSTTCVFAQLRTLLPVSVGKTVCRVSSACSRPRAPGLSGRAALQPGSPQPRPRQGVLSLLGQNFAFGLVEFHKVPVGSICHFAGGSPIVGQMDWFP